MLSSSILGAISSVLLLNPHLGLGAHLGSLSTQVSPRQQGALSFIEAPLSKREQESSSAPSGSAAVDAALDKIFYEFHSIYIESLLHHYETIPELKEGIRDIMTSERNPSDHVKEELIETALKYAMKELWRLSEGEDIPVAYLNDIFKTLQFDARPDGGFMMLLKNNTRRAKELFIKNVFRFVGPGNFEPYFPYIVDYISSRTDRDDLLVASLEKKEFKSEDFQERLSEMEAVDKYWFAVNVLPHLPKAKFDYLFANVVSSRIASHAISGQKLF